MKNVYEKFCKHPSFELVQLAGKIGLPIPESRDGKDHIGFDLSKKTGDWKEKYLAGCHLESRKEMEEKAREIFFDKQGEYPSTEDDERYIRFLTDRIADYFDERENEE